MHRINNLEREVEAARITATAGKSPEVEFPFQLTPLSYSLSFAEFELIVTDFLNWFHCFGLNCSLLCLFVLLQRLPPETQDLQLLPVRMQCYLIAAFIGYPQVYGKQVYCVC